MLVVDKLNAIPQIQLEVSQSPFHTAIFYLCIVKKSSLGAFVHMRYSIRDGTKVFEDIMF